MEEEYSTKGMPNGYIVSSFGNIKNSEGKLLKLSNKIKGDNSSYLVAHLVINDNLSKTFRVNRLVATAFVPNPLNLPAVNHKDGIKRNNLASNLEWCTDSQNMQHAYDMKLKLPTNGRKVQATNLITKEIFEFDSVWAASRHVKGQQPNVYMCCMGKRRSHKGYEFKFI